MTTEEEMAQIKPTTNIMLAAAGFGHKPGTGVRGHAAFKITEVLNANCMGFVLRSQFLGAASQANAAALREILDPDGLILLHHLVEGTGRMDLHR